LHSRGLILPVLAILIEKAAAARHAPLTDAERERFSKLYEAHHDLVWRVLRRAGLSVAQADDGAQQVYLVALKRLEDIRPEKERAFLCATALMVARRLRQTGAREVPADEVPEVDAGTRPDEEVERRRNRALLGRLLEQLDEDLRAVFVLQEIEGLSKREAADALGIPQGTAATRLRRARVAFNDLLRREMRGRKR
jgi:RNA polymerase sigma-70 factor, ECF subfamily